MYLGWFCFGGNEVINNPRAVSYARSAGCPVTWFVGNDDLDSRSIIQMTEGAAEGENLALYDYANAPTEAPWASPGSTIEDVAAWGFLGVYCLSADGLVDSTREVESTQRIRGGSALSRERHASRRVRFRVLLSATQEQGIEFGMSWLNSVLAEQSCTTHVGGSCGTTDMTFFQNLNGTWTFNDEFGPGMYDQTVDLLTRRMHGCKVISGPLVQRELVSESNGARGRIVEFTVEAEQPFIYGVSIPTLGANTGSGVRVQDAPVNYIKVPNLRAATTPALLMTNYCLNPSVETDASGWAMGIGGSIGVTTGLTGTRSTLEYRYGVASYQARYVVPSTSAVTGWFSVQNDVALPAYVAGRRWSISMWAKANIESGTAVLGPITYEAVWLTAANAVLRTDVLGELPIAGGALSARGLERPPTATKVRVRARLEVISRTAAAVIRLYGDAISVTTP